MSRNCSTQKLKILGEAPWWIIYQGSLGFKKFTIKCENSIIQTYDLLVIKILISC
uniref:Uncharacterized protein n=1 Tax=Rhizophora mucronata TaxID=61149 RepID=A0A2P2IZG7_RHIMU